MLHNGVKFASGLTDESPFVPRLSQQTIFAHALYSGQLWCSFDLPLSSNCHWAYGRSTTFRSSASKQYQVSPRSPYEDCSSSYSIVLVRDRHL
ncbi:hypothetical protein PILCRDRAFT_830393 [Piloderma croceum F 1598]|uniref:Uncharacterized protein n=1 Tax=Piloderma croceum (strain F 1598) TaxID=765440 RepID=A0A0C3ETE4_PILCF|nr:hypothetical protein PILCRDRAFT_830393 [Piloderma croceum F 1598]